MDSRDMQVIGLCRFSYPALGGFQVEHESAQARAAYLYDPSRIDERFRMFEAFTIPALRTQTDADFTFVVVIGEDFPAPMRDRLEALLEDLPQTQVQAWPAGPHREVMREAINAARDERKAPCLQFRMDDDDAVSVHFVERLRSLAQECRPLLRHHPHVAFDFNTGWVASPGPDGIRAAQVTEALWTPALAMSAKGQRRNTIMNFGHSKLGRFMPVVSMPTAHMFIRGHNDHNDSRQKENIRQFKLAALDAEGEALFRAEFNVDADAVRAIYARA